MTDYRTHPEYRALLAAVLATPGDDLPRLVLADWLEERGETERIEFIRVQCALVRWKDKEHCPKCGEHWRFGSMSLDHSGQDYECNKEHRWKTADYDSLRRRERELWDSGLYAVFKREVPPGVHVLLPGWTSGSPIEAYSRRGFVAEVRCTLADWCGGLCECFTNEPSYGGCDDCGGSGRVPGIGPRLVREHPIERVVVTDKEPADRTAVNGSWYWFRNGRNALGDWQDENHLPDVVFDHLPGAVGDTIGLPYPTRDDAIAALSAVLIAWAKSTEPRGWWRIVSTR